VIKFILVFMVCAFAVTACGVKGDPIPPSKPIEIDDGNPFKNQRFDEEEATNAATPTPSPSPTPKPKMKKRKKK
jgi:hypothetical protein